MKDNSIETGLLKILPAGRIKTRYIDLVSYGADAGFYFLLPKAVVKPVSEEEVVQLFAFSHQHKIPLVFRTGGTSLSGQSITDGILVDLSQYWNKLSVSDDGGLVRVQPGITGAMVNAWLKKFSRKIGPDPSSISAAMMGGILSNNSSGMCCGVTYNSYHTTKFIRFILPDGKTFTNEHVDDFKRFEKECPGIFQQLTSLRTAILSTPVLFERIRKKYVTKNTVGYSLNAFIDHEHPLDILCRLLIGAEGTLAFIAEAVMETVPDYPYKSTALLYFPDIGSACAAIVPLKHAGAEAVELMDRASLRSVELFPGMPAVVKTLPPHAAALLVEFQDNDIPARDDKVNRFMQSLNNSSLLFPPVFTTDADEQAFLWKVRKGLFPAVGAVRVSGTTVILEDIAFPVEKLGDAIIDLHRLFAEFDYTNAIIFGHAKDGNLHFVITQSFNEAHEVDRYDRFLRAVVELVVKKYDGTLKAEHGTGRNMAPFVETEWGGDAYQIMQQLKACIDPQNLLNPGVIINDDKNLHIKNMKVLPMVEAEVDRCIECGYCEHRCPSRDITTTPRRRIVLRRELERLKHAGDETRYKEVLHDYQYDGLDTCAVDGLCATACPVDINTGDLVKRLRRENHSSFQNRVALTVAKNFRATEFFVKAALRSGNMTNRLFGSKTMYRLTGTIKKLAPSFPRWSQHMGTVPASPKTVQSTAGHIVYFPACITRVMGSGSNGKKDLMQTFTSVCSKVGIGVIVPPNIKGSCCGQIFSSKGFAAAYRYKANDIVERLWEASRHGEWKIVTDVGSCAYTLRNIRAALAPENVVKYDAMVMMDSVEFLHDEIMPRAGSVNKISNVVLHPVCSLEKMGTGKKFVAVAKFFADRAVVPLSAGCCGMAGDRGFLFPELTASAAAPEAHEVRNGHRDANGYYSSTKTCEMAMTDAVGANYESVLYLVDEALGTKI